MAPRKNNKTCPTSNCQRPADHLGRHGPMTKTELASVVTSKPVTTKRLPISQARTQVATDPATKRVADVLPKTTKKSCPACGRRFVTRPSGLLPTHKVDGLVCDQQPIAKSRPAKKKVACVVSQKDGCGRKIGVMPATGLVAKHTRTDGSPCPGSDLVPGSPLPTVKKRATPKLNPNTTPASRPHHDRSDRSAYFQTPALQRSLMKADGLHRIVEQYGWEGTQRTRPDNLTVELTLTRGSETIHIYWVGGVCAGEDITYTVDDREVKLRNASAVKMRAALDPEAAMAEVKAKMANAARVRKQTETMAADLSASQRKATLKLRSEITELHDEDVVVRLTGKWVGWMNRISQKEEIGLISRDPRKIQVKPTVLGDDRMVTFSDPEIGFRTFRLSALTRLQSTAMRRRRNGNNEDENNETAPTRKQKVSAAA